MQGKIHEVSRVRHRALNLIFKLIIKHICYGKNLNRIYRFICKGIDYYGFSQVFHPSQCLRLRVCTLSPLWNKSCLLTTPECLPSSFCASTNKKLGSPVSLNHFYGAFLLLPLASHLVVPGISYILVSSHVCSTTLAKMDSIQETYG